MTKATICTSIIILTTITIIVISIDIRYCLHNIIVIRDNPNKYNIYKVIWLLAIQIEIETLEVNLYMKIGKKVNKSIKYIVLFHHRRSFTFHTRSCTRDINHLRKTSTGVHVVINVIRITLTQITILICVIIELNSELQDQRSTPLHRHDAQSWTAHLYDHSETFNNLMKRFIINPR